MKLKSRSQRIRYDPIPGADILRNGVTWGTIWREMVEKNARLDRITAMTKIQVWIN